MPAMHVPAARRRAQLPAAKPRRGGAAARMRTGGRAARAALPLGAAMAATRLRFSADGAPVPAAGLPAWPPYDDALGFGVPPEVTKGVTDLLKRSILSLLSTVADEFFPRGDAHPLRQRYFTNLRESGPHALNTHQKTLLTFAFLAHCHRVPLPPLEEFWVGKRTANTTPHRVAFEHAFVYDAASGMYDAVYAVMSARPPGLRAGPHGRAARRAQARAVRARRSGHRQTRARIWALFTTPPF
jgi:hypothetical protein